MDIGHALLSTPDRSLTS